MARWFVARWFVARWFVARWFVTRWFVTRWLTGRGLRFTWRQALIAVVVALLFWWVARAISWQATWATLTNLQPHELLLLAAANGAVFATFTARWWLFLRVQGHRIAYLQLVRYRLTAFGISYFTPGPHFGGEPYQVYIVSARHNVPVQDAVAAVALDKLLEMLVNFAFLAGGVLVLALNHQQLPAFLGRQLTLYALILLALPGLALIWLMLGRHPLSGPLYHLGGKRAAAARWLAAIRSSEDQAIWLCRTHPRTVWAAIGLSTVVWLGIVAEFWLLTRLLDLPLRFSDAIYALVAARIAILLPLPAALGVLEAGQALAMSSLGLPPSYGASIALLLRARDVVTGLTGLALGGTYSWSLSAPADPAPALPRPVKLDVAPVPAVTATPTEPTARHE